MCGAHARFAMANVAAAVCVLPGGLTVTVGRLHKPAAHRTGECGLYRRVGRGEKAGERCESEAAVISLSLLPPARYASNAAL